MKWGHNCSKQAVVTEKMVPHCLVKKQFANRHLTDRQLTYRHLLSTVTKDMLAILMKWGLSCVNQAVVNEKVPCHLVKNQFADQQTFDQQTFFKHSNKRRVTQITVDEMGSQL